MSSTTAAPWRGVLLIPSWVLQMILLIIGISLYSYWAKRAATYLDIIMFTWITVIVLFALCLILTIVEIVLFTRRALSTSMMLALQVFKCSFMTVCWLYVIVELAEGLGHRLGAAFATML
ncbi:hypothetical protein LTR66_010054 [Elasticomyces elasticus]|nr:hypothetical protein LTR66_010054 [Elasticomyces elasticus]